MGLSRILCSTGAMLLCAQFLAVLLNAEKFRLWDIRSIITRKLKRLKYCIPWTDETRRFRSFRLRQLYSVAQQLCQAKLVKYRAFIGGKLLSHSIEIPHMEGTESACLIGPWDSSY